MLSTDCFRTNLTSRENCFLINPQAVMSIEYCTSCSGCTCGQSHGSPLLRPCCSHYRAPKPCNGRREAWLLLQSLDLTMPSDVSYQELSWSILDKCICYVPPSQKSIPCASCVHSRELVFLLMNQIDTHNKLGNSASLSSPHTDGYHAEQQHNKTLRVAAKLINRYYI